MKKSSKWRGRVSSNDLKVTGCLKKTFNQKIIFFFFILLIVRLITQIMHTFGCVVLC